MSKDIHSFFGSSSAPDVSSSVPVQPTDIESDESDTETPASNRLCHSSSLETLSASQGTSSTLCNYLGKRSSTGLSMMKICKVLSASIVESGAQQVQELVEHG